MTGCDRKLTSTPSRSMPSPSRRTPTISASMIDSAMKVSLPAEA